MKPRLAVRTAGFLLAAGLCLLLFAPITIQPALADLGKGDLDQQISLVRATFDPLLSTPLTPAHLSYSEAEAAAAGTYLLQFSGPVRAEWKQQAAAAGAILGPYVPANAFIVHLDQAALSRLKSLPFVRWIGPYQPAYKLAPDVYTAAPRSYRVILAPWAKPFVVADQVAAFGTRLSTSPDSLTVDLDAPNLEAAARLGEVLWIEPYHLQKAYNDIAGGTIMGGSTAWSRGYTGAGVIVAVTDTGLDTGSISTVHQDFHGRVSHLASKRVQNINWGLGCTPSNTSADDGAADRESGHGTHVTGSLAGNGAASGGQFKGLAYQATIVFQAVEQWTTWPAGCSSYSDGYYLTGIPNDIRTLLSEDYNWGARVQNDSWGGGDPGEYDLQAAYFDDFVYRHPDFSVVVAAGNDGTDANNNGYVDKSSVDSPGTAKNLIVVGATENERSGSGGGYSDLTWGEAWPSDYDQNPTGGDSISTSREEMAAFSSRGPTDDGRIKPDLVAPGTDIISVRSSQASETGWGIYNSNYIYMGGTSMASPLTAGAAALVRQFYLVHEHLADPSAALIKATLINTAVDITGYGNSAYEAGQPIPNEAEGWGRVDVAAATASGRTFVDEAGGVATSATDIYQYYVFTGAPFKVTLVWSDYPANPAALPNLVNDLNLKVTSPDHTIYWGNHFNNGWSVSGGSYDHTNNVENVYIQNPSTGIWKVEVTGRNVPYGPQPFALVIGGDVHLPDGFLKIAPVDGATGQVITSTLSWESSDGAASYEVCIDTSPNTACDNAWISTGINTCLQPDNLGGSATYSWQVRARNSAGATDADAGAWYTFTVQAGPPGTFHKIAPSGSPMITTTSPILSWGLSLGADGYRYCYDTTDNGACDSSWIPTTGLSATLSALDNDTTYYWQVQADNGDGSVGADNDFWASFTVQLGTPGDFQKVTPLSGASEQPLNPTLSWEASSQASGYEVCLDRIDNDACDTAWVQAALTNRPVSGLVPGAAYYWQVRATNSAGTTEASNGWWHFETTPRRLYLPQIRR